MPKSWNDLKIGISGGAWVLLAMSLLVLPLRWIMAAITAAVVHESCHALAVSLCGGRLRTLSVGKSGAVMVADPMTPTREFFCTMAGPLGSALLVLTFPWLPRVAFCSAVHCVYNLLPIYPLDGGRALRCIAAKFPEKQQRKLCAGVERLCLIALFAGAVYLTVWVNMGMTPLILVAVLFLRTKSVKPPCKKENLALQ
jgi:stage IV sporulation protein FB